MLHVDIGHADVAGEPGAVQVLHSAPGGRVRDVLHLHARVRASRIVNPLCSHKHRQNNEMINEKDEKARV